MAATLIGAVARVMDPGCKFNTCCVPMGAQALWKSTFWKCLASEVNDGAFQKSQTPSDAIGVHRILEEAFAVRKASNEPRTIARKRDSLRKNLANRAFSLKGY